MNRLPWLRSRQETSLYSKVVVVTLALLLARVVPRAIPTELVDHRTLAHTALRCDEDEDTARKVVPRQKTSIEA